MPVVKMSEERARKVLGGGLILFGIKRPVPEDPTAAEQRARTAAERLRLQPEGGGLKAAYEAALFEVDSSPRKVFQVAMKADHVAPWLQAQGALRAVVITAWNPFSEPLEDDLNWDRMLALKAALAATGQRWMDAMGRAPDGDDPGEPSVCVFDAPPELVEKWLKEFEQYAVLDIDAHAGCVLRRHPTASSK